MAQNRQAKSSTARDPSEFEKSLAGTASASSKKMGTKSRKRTRTGHKREAKKPSPEPTDSSEYHDSEEDELVYQETVRLFELHGNSEPLWILEPNLAGMTRATQAYAL